MKPNTFISDSPRATMDFAKRFVKNIRPGSILCLFGDLGSGKTTFVKGLASGLGISPDEVHSPTFTFMNIYAAKALDLYHFDLYRTESEQDILALGYEEFFHGRGISVVEWSEKLGKLLPEEYIRVTFVSKGSQKRMIKISHETSAS